jgi:hypothetical protein
MPATVQRSAIAALRERFTLRRTRRTVLIMFSGAGERRSGIGSLSGRPIQHLGDARRLLLNPAGEIAPGFVGIVECSPDGYAAPIQMSLRGLSAPRWMLVSWLRLFTPI